MVEGLLCFLKCFALAQISPSANINDKDTKKKRHPWVSYTLRFLYQTRLTLHLEEHDRSSLVVAIPIVGLSISKSKSMSCKGP